MPKLSDTQAALLAAAAARPDLNLMPIPETIKLKGSALDRALKSLLERNLVAEGTAAGRQPKQKGKQFVVTPAGLAAIGVELPDATPDLADDEPSPERPGGKLGVLLDAVAKPKGATLDELTSASGWLPHTTRAALTRLRQRGFDVRLATTDGRKAYHLMPAA